MKNVIAIFDVGKTNKKLLLFDEQYKVVLEKTARFNEITDEDGFPCENLDSLISSVHDSLQEVLHNRSFSVKAVNFSGYGASFVFVDDNGDPVTPLYNYLKPFPEKLLQQFYDTYGGENNFSRQTASPVLGNLNSGMQLYRLRYEKPALFAKIKHALHLPQFLAWLVSRKMYAEITSIGCHTNLWDFQKNDYHEWVTREGLLDKMLPIAPAHKIISTRIDDREIKVGIGLHDSSAALIPYLVSFKEPFVLISTGTWCITLNPFNATPLTNEELKNDCLCYLQYNDKPVKAARLFAGHDHDIHTKRIAAHFDTDGAFYRNCFFNDAIVTKLKKTSSNEPISLKHSAFANRELSSFVSAEEAYHQLMIDIVAQQYISTRLVLDEKRTKRIFVDGGFSKNDIYMNLLAASFPGTEVFATFMAQASALGAALAIHSAWNKKPVPRDIIELRYYAATAGVSS